jgi:hypothetical protein
MTTYAAEDFEAIRRRQEEIRAEKDLALTGSSVPDAVTVGEYAAGYALKPGDLHPMYMGVDYDPA